MVGRPDQFSATTVVSIAVRYGSAMETSWRRDPCAAARSACDPETAGEHAPSQVELLHVAGDGVHREVEPVAVLDAEGERLPVGQVDDEPVLEVVPSMSSGHWVTDRRDVGPAQTARSAASRS
jgi:hypothetical protein